MQFNQNSRHAFFFFLTELGKSIPDCIWKSKKQEQHLKTEKVRGFALSDLRTYNNKTVVTDHHSVALTYGQMRQNRDDPLSLLHMKM